MQLVCAGHKLKLKLVLWSRGRGLSSWSTRMGPAPRWAGLALCPEVQASSHTLCHSELSCSLLGTTWQVEPSSIAQTQNIYPGSSTLKPDFVRREA